MYLCMDNVTISHKKELVVLTEKSEKKNFNLKF